jgi:hypothetical protein
MDLFGKGNILLPRENMAKEPLPDTAEGNSEVIEASSPMVEEIRLGRIQRTRNTRIERVSVYPWEGQNGKPCFRLALELDPTLDPSNRHRRTVTVLGLELEIEEKELPALARLSGRWLNIHFLFRDSEIQQENLLLEIDGLKKEILKLREKLSSTREQLQFAIDSQRER